MNLNSKILASYYLQAIDAENDIKYYKTDPRMYNNGPYWNSIISLLISYILFEVFILTLFCKFNHINVKTGNNVISLDVVIIGCSIPIWLFILKLIYPENKMDDLVKEFKNTPGIDLKYWKRISFLSVLVPGILFLITLFLPIK